jgi:RNA recognition motif-containing protein
MKLYVDGLPEYMDEYQIRTLFERAGAVKTVQINLHRKTGRSNGSALVEMEDRQGAQKAIAFLNGTELERIPLLVELE